MRARARAATGGVPIRERGPGWSYAPDESPPSTSGAHQPGIATPQLDHLALAGLDVTLGRAAELRDLLRAWSAEAERLMAAEHGTPGGHGLTLTLGLGPGLFERGGRDPYGLRGARPLALRALPAFAGDALDPGLCGGDVCVQSCARDARTALEAVERLLDVARGAAGVRWIQRGTRTARGAPSAGTPRDVLGFKDGTNNLRRPRDLERRVWIGDRERSWMVGGTMLVVRRIEVAREAWDALAVEAQEAVIGRRRDSGAPLGREREFDPVPLWRTRPDGTPVVAHDAHARLAAPAANGGATMLRRGYSFEGDADPGTGRARAGLVFLAYQRDPRRQFVPVQRALAERDALSAFTRTVGSAVFAIPPGARPGGFLGEGLLAAARGATPG